MIGIFVDYLRNSPVEFELLISVVSSQNEQICREKFTQKTLPKMKALIIKLTPNRGRDVAPFLIAFKDEALKYDYLAHIHTKKTPHDRALSGWADYLFANLISPEAIENIIAHLANDENLGIVFPPIYHKLYHDGLFLDERDRQNMLLWLGKMGIEFSPTSTNFVFSPGTMFWVRPSAIKRLFELNLRYEDFHAEPIALTGTTSHAFERCFAVVSEFAGFKTRYYATRQTLVNALFEMIDYKHGNDKHRYVRITLFGAKVFKMRKRRLITLTKRLPLRYLRKHKLAKYSPIKIKKLV